MKYINKKIFKKILNKRFLFILLGTILIVLFFPRGESAEFNVEVGDVWNYRDLIADFYFPVLKDESEYKKEVELAARSVLPVFVLKDSIKNANIENLKKVISGLKKDIIEKKKSSEIDPAFIKSEYSKIFGDLDYNNFVLQNKTTISDMLDNSLETLEFFYSKGILSEKKYLIKKDSLTLRNNITRNFDKNSFLDLDNVDSVIAVKVNSLFPGSFVLRTAYNRIVKYFTQPNIIYSSYHTQQKQEIEKSRVSRNIGIIAKNEKIIEKHQRVSPELKAAIDSYRKFRQERIGTVNLILQNLGKFLHVGIFILLYVLYIFFFRKKIFYSDVKVFLITVIFVIVAAFAWLTNVIDFNLPLEFFILLPVGSMLLTIFFDSRVGFYGTVILALIVGGIKGNSYSITMVNIISGSLAVYSVRDIKSRNQIFRSILFIFLGYFFAITALGLERHIEFSIYWRQLFVAFLTSVISPILTNGLLIFFEKTLKITTDLTLLELQNPNHPLIRELQLKTPGTYHHSNVIGTLAESAARAIGANAILARVGAVYHDIGKTITPSYYIENQKEGNNPLDGLTPEEAAKKIIAHVENGIELAHQYNLPQEVIDFIPMHHGTTTAKYFLALAKKQKREIDESLFRYPGPTPNTKETAIIMLADAIESTSRSLDEPSINELESVIDKTIKERLEAGQLNDCNLNFRELNEIKNSFLVTLEGIYHSRIVYPSGS